MQVRQYANVVASLALFAALGGSSYAAIAVTGAQVRDGSLTGRDVRNSSLTGKDVRNQSLLAQDFRPGQLPAGPQGPRAIPVLRPAGASGRAGRPAGVAGYEIVESTSPATSDNKFRDRRVPARQGGGRRRRFLLGDFTGHVALDHSQPLGNDSLGSAGCRAGPDRSARGPSASRSSARNAG